jgi:hypothetical protein
VSRCDVTPGERKKPIGVSRNGERAHQMCRGDASRQTGRSPARQRGAERRKPVGAEDNAAPTASSESGTPIETARYCQVKYCFGI